jgi:hypothetical protein
VLVAANPDLPSEAIKAVKRSIDYWQRAVNWIPDHLDQLRKGEKEAEKKDAGPAPWCRPMLLALTEQASIWQTLMTGQQSLRAYNMESVTHKIMQEVTDEIQRSARTDFSSGMRQAEQAMKVAAHEMKEAIEVVGKTAVDGLEDLFQHSRQLVLGAIAVVLVVLAVVAFILFNDKLGTASGGVGLTGVFSAILGYFGLGKLTSKKAEQQTAIRVGKNSATTKLEKTGQGAARAAEERGGGNLLTRIEGAAKETGAMILEAFEKGYRQIRIELDGLNRSVAVAYPLVEFFSLTFLLKSEASFLTEIIWSGKERTEEAKQVMRAAFGPIAMLITPSSSEPGGEEAAPDAPGPEKSSL